MEMLSRMPSSQPMSVMAAVVERMEPLMVAMASRVTIRSPMVRKRTTEAQKMEVRREKTSPSDI